MDPTIRVVIAEDEPVFRQGLRALLSTEPDIEVVGEAATGSEAVDLAIELLPDVVLMDLHMDGFDGLTALRTLREKLGTCRVLVLTMFDSNQFLFEAIRAGAV